MEDDLSFDWDRANIEHVGQHGVIPPEVLEVFANETLDLGYEVADGEERWTSIGHNNEFRVLVVVWTMRGDAIRPITAFEANKRLTSDYVRQKGW